jgi:hypothetical protein
LDIDAGGCRTASATSEVSAEGTAISLSGRMGSKPDWLVSMIIASGPFSSEAIRIGGSIECDSMSLFGGGAGSRELAARSSMSNVPPTHRK